MRRSTARIGRHARGSRTLLAILVPAALLALAAASWRARRRDELHLARPRRPAPPSPARVGHGPSPARVAADAAREPAEAAGVEGLMALTRDELYTRARERGLQGRSRMSKRELAEALARRG